MTIAADADVRERALQALALLQGRPRPGTGPERPRRRHARLAPGPNVINRYLLSRAFARGPVPAVVEDPYPRRCTVSYLGGHLDALLEFPDVSKEQHPAPQAVQSVTQRRG